MTKKRRYLICAAVIVAFVCLSLGLLVMLPAEPWQDEVFTDKLRRWLRVP